MRIIYFLIKMWITSFLLFIFVSFIIPSKRIFADGEVYINSKIYKNPVSTKKPHILIETDTSHNLLQKVEQWQHHSHPPIKNVVFIIPRYEVVIYYCYLKQQDVIAQQNYKISATSEIFDIKRILVKFHETIGSLVEYVVDNTASYIGKIFSKIQNNNRK